MASSASVLPIKQRQKLHTHTAKRVAEFLNKHKAVIVPVIEGAGQGLEMPVVTLIKWLQEKSKSDIWVYISNESVCEKFLKLLAPVNVSERVSLFLGYDGTVTDSSYSLLAHSDFQQKRQSTTELVTISPASDTKEVARQIAEQMGVKEMLFFQPFKWQSKDDRGIIFKDNSQWRHFKLSGHLYHDNAGAPLMTGVTKPADLSEKLASLSIEQTSVLPGLLQAAKDKKIFLVTLYIHYLAKPFDALFLNSLNDVYADKGKPAVFLIVSHLEKTSLGACNELKDETFPEDVSNLVYMLNHGAMPQDKLHLCMSHSQVVVCEGGSMHSECLNMGVPVLSLGSVEETEKRFNLSPQKQKSAEKTIFNLARQARRALVPEGLINALAWNYVPLVFGMGEETLSQCFAKHMTKIDRGFLMILKDPNDDTVKQFYESTLLWIWQQFSVFKAAKPDQDIELSFQQFCESFSEWDSLKNIGKNITCFKMKNIIANFLQMLSMICLSLLM